MKEVPVKYVKISATQCDILKPGEMRMAITGNEDDARRLCAAVNACEGIETEMLEKVGVQMPVYPTELDRLRAQNAKFVFLLRQADKLDRDGYTLTSTWFHEVRNALAKYDQPGIEIPRHDGGQDVFASKEAAALKIIFDADESEKASGGEMWYAEVVADAIKKARNFLDQPDPDHTKATIL